MQDTITDRDGQAIAIVVWGTKHASPGCHFYTGPLLEIQVGAIVIGNGEAIPGHIHPPITRTITRTTEVIIVQKGRILVTFLDDTKNLVDTRILEEGELMIQLRGGHSFKALEDCRLLEVKQGPYVPDKDKMAI
jgi:hypothetical protein